MAYGKVEETFWHDAKIRNLSEPARWFYMYLLTSPHRNRLGCFLLDPQYAAADIQWPPEKVMENLRQLHEDKRVEWDSENRVVFIRKFLAHNTMKNRNSVLGAIGELKTLPDTPLLHPFLEALRDYGRPHYQELIEAVERRVKQIPQAEIHSTDHNTAHNTAHNTDRTTNNGEGTPDSIERPVERPVKPVTATATATATVGSLPKGRSPTGASPDVENSDDGSLFGWDEFAQWMREEGCPTYLWQGQKPHGPRGPADPWNLGRELSICKQLQQQGEDLELLKEAIKLVPTIDLPPPVTMRLFWQHGERQRYHELKGRALKNQERARLPSYPEETKVRVQVESE